LVLRETAFLAIAGIALGIGMTFVLKSAMNQRFPTLLFPVGPHWITYATLIAFFGAMVGAVYPALKAAHKDPIEALAYE
jgi:putative ABC transport system permease protein